MASLTPVSVYHITGLSQDLGKVQRLFASVQPDGTTPIGARLEELLLYYMEKLDEAKARGDAKSIKPINYVILTDGAPSAQGFYSHLKASDPPHSGRPGDRHHKHRETAGPGKLPPKPGKPHHLSVVQPMDPNLAFHLGRHTIRADRKRPRRCRVSQGTR